MKFKTFAVTLATLFFVGCDTHEYESLENVGLDLVDVSTAEFNQLAKHWVYNPGLCDDEIVINGLFDLKISKYGIQVGGNSAPIKGQLKELKIPADISTFISEIKSCSGQAVDIDEVKFFNFSSKNLNASLLISGEGVWFINNNMAYFLKEFEKFNFSQSISESTITNKEV